MSSFDTPVVFSVLRRMLNDFELNVDHLMITLQEEPRNYNESIMNNELIIAMKAEIDSIKKNNK